MATSDVITETKSSKKLVYIKVVFTNLSGVNTMREQFNAEIYIRARWREPKLDSSKQSDFNKANMAEYWNPSLNVMNKVSESKSKIWNDVWTNSSGEAFLREHRQISGTFSEKLELHSFPFDHQDLTISISSLLPDKEFEFAEDELSRSELGLKCFLFKQEWKYQKFVDLIPRVISKDYNEGFKKGEAYPSINVRVVAIRKYGFFVWNIILLMTLISSFPITTFAIEKNNVQRRLLLGFILALTGVAFRFMANQNIPKIPYQTLLDRYILASMMYNYFVAVWHVIVSRFDDIGDDQSRMDRIAFIVSVAIYLVIQLIFFIIVLVKILSGRKYVQEKERAYQQRHSIIPPKISTTPNGDVDVKPKVD